MQPELGQIDERVHSLTLRFRVVPSADGPKNLSAKHDDSLVSRDLNPGPVDHTGKILVCR
eukprot:15263013-Alexandrium_andersonii.AAC.1